MKSTDIFNWHWIKAAWLAVVNSLRSTLAGPPRPARAARGARLRRALYVARVIGWCAILSSSLVAIIYIFVVLG